MKVFCLAGLVKSNLFHITCATCNIFYHFSYAYALIQLLENVQVDESCRNNWKSNQSFTTTISVHGNKPYFDINRQICIMLNIPPIPRIHLTFHQSRGFTEHFTNPSDSFNIPPIPRIRLTFHQSHGFTVQSLSAETREMFMSQTFSIFLSWKLKSTTYICQKIDFEYLRCNATKNSLFMSSCNTWPRVLFFK